MPTSFHDAALAFSFGEDDVARLVVLATALVPHAERIASALAPVTDDGAEVVAWVTTTLAGPWDEALYDAGVAIGRRCAERDVPWARVSAAFAAVRSTCLDVIAERAPDTPVATIRALDRLLDLQLAICLQAYQLRAGARSHVALQTLSAGLAHELRNPLNSARLQLEVLDRRLRKANADDDLAAPIASARHEIDRLGALVKDFIAFAQPATLALTAVDTNDVLARALDAERPLAESRGVIVSLDAPEIRARADKDKLQQIVQHLVRNAIEATPTGGLVALTSSDAGDRLRITVSDTGGGIPDAVVRRLYEPFFSTKEAGTGLGMSIVQSLVALHDGTVAIATSPAGTRIDVVLPKR